MTMTLGLLGITAAAFKNSCYYYTLCLCVVTFGGCNSFFTLAFFRLGCATRDGDRGVIVTLR